MVIVDRTFECQDKEEVNMSKNTRERALLANAGIWRERMRARYLHCEYAKGGGNNG